MTTVQGLHHVALTVRDVAVSTTWYVEMFGMVRLQEAQNDGHRSTTLMHPGSQLVLQLHEWEAGASETFDEQRVGLDHLGLRVGSRAELEGWQERLRERAVTFSPIADMTYGHVLAFRDPDGIQLELFALPSSFWSHPTAV